MALNVTTLDATAPTFLTIYPAGATRPDASHLNPSPNQPPTPNAVTTNLGSGEQFSIYNKDGNVHVLADVVGYYVSHSHPDPGSYAVEKNVGDAPKTLVEVGPLTYSMTCVQSGTDIDLAIRVTSSVDPWYIDETEYAAGYLHQIDDASTGLGDPYTDYWYETIGVPSEGVWVLDDGYRNGYFMGYPGADCRGVGTILPSFTD